MRVEPGLSQTAVLVFANDVVHDVGQQTGHHQDLHVITLPAVLQMCRNLQRNSTQTSIRVIEYVLQAARSEPP